MRSVPTFSVLLLLLIGFAPSPAAYAFLRAVYEDAVVVDRSELIVIGQLEAKSVEYVPHKKSGNEGASGEHHARLVITEVLKGKVDEKEVPIIIHYGLTPVIRGNAQRRNFKNVIRGANVVAATDIIEIMDTGNSSRSMASFVEDACKENVWLLRRRAGIFGREPGTGAYGVVDPEDIQPLRFKDYLLCYLSSEPEASVKALLRKDPTLSERAQRYLDHLAVERILRVADAGERFDKLLPYFLNRMTWDMKPVARNGIVACGAVAGRHLVDVFEDPSHKHFRTEIIRMWGEMGYRDASSILIDLLTTSDAFWAEQNLEAGWWNSDVESGKRALRRQVYSETYYALNVLRKFKDQRARPSIALTRERWRSIAFDKPQIVEACDAALRALAEDDATRRESATGVR